MKLLLSGCTIVALLGAAGFAAADFAAEPDGQIALNWLRSIYDAVTGQDQGNLRDHVGVKNSTNGISRGSLAAERGRIRGDKGRAASQSSLKSRETAGPRRRRPDTSTATARVSRPVRNTTGATALTTKAKPSRPTVPPPKRRYTGHLTGVPKST